MATTVTAADLTVSIKETYTLNGVTYGNSNNKTYTSNGQVLQRVMNVSTSDPAILNFGAADAAGQVKVGDYKWGGFFFLQSSSRRHFCFNEQ